MSESAGGAGEARHEATEAKASAPEHEPPEAPVEEPKHEPPAEEPKREPPAEEPPKHEPPAEEPPKHEPPAEEPPKHEPPAGEPPEDEVVAEARQHEPAGAEGGHEELLLLEEDAEEHEGLLVEDAEEHEPAPAPAVEEPKHEPPAEEPAPEAPPVEEPPHSEPPVEEPVPEAPPIVEPPPPPPAPSITGVSPDHGPLAGGAAVKVSGTAFVAGCKVLIGGVESVTHFESETTLIVETPARDHKGLAELRVVNPDEQLAIYEEDFRYDPAPTILGIEPACVSTEGGAVITILGTELLPGCSVRIDGTLVPSSWAHAGRVEAVSKKHDAGEVDLVIENPDTQRVVRPLAVRFAAPPRVDRIAPDTALTAGGALVTVTGSGFEPGGSVLVGGTAAPGLVFVSHTELRFPAPPHLAVETVDVAVVNPTGLTYRLPQALTYTQAPPRVTSVAPAVGPNDGGTQLTVLGHDFAESVAVFVCGIAVKVLWKSRGELVVATPQVSRDGLVDVRVVNPDDQSDTAERAFRYVAPLPPPKLRQVGPAIGSQLGGLEVALLGEDFAEGVEARFGGVPATVRFLTGKELSAITPAFTGYGEVVVEVVNPDGQISMLEAAFTYEPRPAPEVTGIGPTSGPTTGGTRVVIEGQRFTRECVVYVGREYPKDLVFKSPTELHIVTAARKLAGVVDVEVVMPGAPRAVMKNGFRYDAMPAPSITSVIPNAGTPGGGTELTISGKNFTKETLVLLDGKAAKTVKLVDAGTLELKTPAGETGKMVDVMVRNADGKEAVQKRAFLYDPRYRG